MLAIRVLRPLTMVIQSCGARATGIRSLSQLYDDIKPMSPELIRKIGERDAALRTEHHALKVNTSADDAADSLEVRRKRLVYRSKQRGWLEVDLLLGSWAAENAHRLSHEDMDAYERILNLETVDIYNVVTGQIEAPEHVCGPLLDELRAYADAHPFGHASAEKYAQRKRDNNLT